MTLSQKPHEKSELYNIQYCVPAVYQIIILLHSRSILHIAYKNIYIWNSTMQFWDKDVTFSYKNTQIQYSISDYVCFTTKKTKIFSEKNQYNM